MGRAVAVALVFLLHVSITFTFAATPDRQRSIFEDEPAQTPDAQTVAPPGPGPAPAPAPRRLAPRDRPAETPATPELDKTVTRSPVPGAEAQRAAEQLVREIFRNEYADASDEGRRSLSRKLLAQAPLTEDLAERFVLLRESADVAAAGGDLEAAEHALDHIPANFDSDGRPQRLAAYQQLLARPELASFVTQACVDAADRAMAAEDFDAAEQFLQLTDAPVAAASAKGGAREFAFAAAAAKRNELRTRRATTQRVAAAREKLKQDPKDASALAGVGRYLCFTQGDWGRGLPMLAESDDARLKLAAAAELKAAKSTNPADHLEAANLWFALRRDFTGVEAAQIAAHAGSIYQSIAPHLSGLRRTLAEKRVAELRGGADPLAGDAVVIVPDAAPIAAIAPSGSATRPVRPTPPSPPRMPRDRRDLPPLAPPSVVFVCDASGSMLGLPFDLLKIELRKAVAALGPQQSFNVVFFKKGGAQALSDKDLLRADEKNKAAAYEWIARQQVASNSDPIPSLRLALSQRPHMLYLLTDGWFDDNEAVIAELRRSNAARRTRINTIAFFAPDAVEADRRMCEDVLKRIAADNGGRFRVVFTRDLAPDGTTPRGAGPTP